MSRHHQSKSQKTGQGIIRSGLSVQELKAITAMRVGVAGEENPHQHKVPQTGVRSYQTANPHQLVAASMLLQNVGGSPQAMSSPSNSSFTPSSMYTSGMNNNGIGSGGNNSNSGKNRLVSHGGQLSSNPSSTFSSPSNMGISSPPHGHILSGHESAHHHSSYHQSSAHSMMDIKDGLLPARQPLGQPRRNANDYYSGYEGGADGGYITLENNSSNGGQSSKYSPALLRSETTSALSGFDSLGGGGGMNMSMNGSGKYRQDASSALRRDASMQMRDSYGSAPRGLLKEDAYYESGLPSRDAQDFLPPRSLMSSPSASSNYVDEMSSFSMQSMQQALPVKSGGFQAYYGDVDNSPSSTTGVRLKPIVPPLNTQNVSQTPKMASGSSMPMHSFAADLSRPLKYSDKSTDYLGIGTNEFASFERDLTNNNSSLGRSLASSSPYGSQQQQQQQQSLNGSFQAAGSSSSNFLPSINGNNNNGSLNPTAFRANTAPKKTIQGSDYSVSMENQQLLSRLNSNQLQQDEAVNAQADYHSNVGNFSERLNSNANGARVNTDYAYLGIVSDFSHRNFDQQLGSSNISPTFGNRTGSDSNDMVFQIAESVLDHSVPSPDYTTKRRGYNAPDLSLNRQSSILAPLSQELR